MKATALNPNLVWYSASNEDTRSEIEALGPEGKSLLCITASGSRTFDLLIANPARIVSIDQNPAQTAFAELLAASYRQLSYAEFSGFAGITPNPDRQAQLDRLFPSLPAEAAAFWRRNRDAIDGGLIYCGKWEGHLRLIQRMAGRRRRNLAERLLAAPGLGAQLDLWREEWDDGQWRLFLRLLAVRPFWIYVLREPGMRFVPPEFDMRAYVRGRFDHAARTTRFAEAPFAWLMLNGAYRADVLPPYLTEAGFEQIRDRIDRVTFLTASLQDHLARCDAGSFGGASLSDYSSYCDAGMQRTVWAGLARAMAPGGRVCERKFFNKSGDGLPAEAGFVRETPLEQRLFEEDRAIFYSFIVAQKGLAG